MANGNVLSQLREMADKEKLATPQALPLLMAAVADIYQNSLDAKAERQKLHDDFTVLNGRVMNNKSDIEELKKRSNLWDVINSFLVVIGTSIMALLNKNG